MRFGEDVELSGDQFDQVKLDEVSKITGVQFPEGSKGLEYFYLGSGIDDALVAKVQIPDDQVEAFLSNSVFQVGSEEGGPLNGLGKAWWDPSSLTERVDRRQELPNAQFLELSCGREKGQFVVYIGWMTS
ncbi:hypothetical protein SAMN02745181_3829 [Rubritalea squalenifaciens DSM 18772]|uniref:Uncharacterized protein n=2 Tax=Rubritalea squalenifaciens TaxID=407226 RepID=A0A1M6SHY2_9BACT|nr:hypothetical protein SAMN02745181_3829 [Rubritalea squalenifaciens DSM 18772]